MRRLHIEDAEVTRIAIRHGISRDEESRDGRGLHGLRLAAGHSCRQMAELFGGEDTTVQRWIDRFTGGGPRGRAFGASQAAAPGHFPAPSARGRCADATRLGGA